MFTPESDGADPLGVTTVPPGPSLEKTNKKIKTTTTTTLPAADTDLSIKKLSTCLSVVGAFMIIC